MLRLKPLREQVIVITGASSGIGLATAEAAAKAGAKLVLASRSEQAMPPVASRLAHQPGQAIFVPCDVAKREQVEAVARAARQNFGRIDTWINNAGTAIYGRLDEVSDEDSRQLFETNFWGIVYGSLVALPYLKEQGGALINVGSEVSEAAVPLLGMYTASKHAVKGFTDSLRVEIEMVDQAPVSITLIQPTAVDTPFPKHARNYQTQEAKLPSPQITPEKVAEAILHAAVTPTRSTKVGTMSKINTFVAKFLPGMGDRMSARLYSKMHSDEPTRRPEGALHHASETTGFVGQKRGSP